MSLRHRFAWIVLIVLGLGAMLQAMLMFLQSECGQSSQQTQLQDKLSANIYMLAIESRNYYFEPGSGEARQKWLALYRELGLPLQVNGFPQERNSEEIRRLRNEYRNLLVSFSAMESIFLDEKSLQGKKARALFADIILTEKNMIQDVQLLDGKTRLWQQARSRRIYNILFWSAFVLTWLAAGAVYLSGRHVRNSMSGLLGKLNVAGDDEIETLAAELQRLSAGLQQLQSSNQEFEQRLAHAGETEDALRKSEASLKRAQEIALLGNWEWDIKTGKMLLSEEVFHIYDLPRVEANVETFRQNVHPEDRAALEKAMESALTGGKLDIEHRIVNSAEEIRIVHVLGEVIRDELGMPEKMCGSSQDITQQKRGEENLRALNHRLESLVSELRRHEREMILVKRLADKLQQCSNLHDSYTVVNDSAQKLFAELSGALAIVREESLVVVAKWGKTEFPEQFSKNSCLALAENKPYSWHSQGPLPQCDHYLAAQQGETLCLPLEIDQQMFATLHFVSPTLLSQDDYRIATAFGDLLRLALSNIRLRETLSQQALHDPLTGLFNRRYLEDALQHEIQRMLRTSSPLSVAMLDIDHFKRFNDEYGHEAGDEVLKALAGILGEKLRRSDISCRYGGEEFTVIMPDSAIDNAKSRLEGICEGLRGKALTHEGRKLPQVTVSIGLVEAPLSGDVVAEKLLRDADAALYDAKRGGRDRIEIAKG